MFYLNAYSFFAPFFGNRPFHGTPCCHGHQPRIAPWQQTGADIYTGSGGCYGNPRNLWSGAQSGYGIDFNMRPGHQRGTDGVLVFDFNKDGRYSSQDVQTSNDLMKSAVGNFDFNRDGQIDRSESSRGRALQRYYARMDSDRDGRLNSWEMNQAGARVWIDSSQGGGVGRDELHSVYRVPAGTGSSQRLDYVDPWTGRTGATLNNGYRPYPSVAARLAPVQPRRSENSGRTYWADKVPSCLM